MAKSVISII